MEPKPVNSFGAGELLSIMRKRMVLILSVFLITTVALFGYKFFGTDYYESSFAFKPNIISPEQTMVVLENLNSMIRHKNSTRLQEKAGISGKVLSGIKPFEFKVVDGQIIEAEIRVIVPSYIPECRNGIIHFLHNNEYLLQQRKQETGRLNTVLGRISAESTELENARKEVVMLLESGRNDLIHFPNDISIQLVEMEKEKATVQKKLDEISTIPVLMEPIVPDEPSGPTNRKLLVISLLSLVFGIFLAVFLENLA